MSAKCLLGLQGPWCEAGAEGTGIGIASGKIGQNCGLWGWESRHKQAAQTDTTGSAVTVQADNDVLVNNGPCAGPWYRTAWRAVGCTTIKVTNDTFLRMLFFLKFSFEDFFH